MGRIIKNEIIGYTCNVKSCERRHITMPVPAGTVWEDQVLDLLQMVEAGWALVLTPQLRSYCPDHAALAYECTCRTHPQRWHLCVEHNEESAALIWVQGDMPAVAARELERIGVMS